MIIKLRTISSNFQNEKFLLFTIFLVGTLFIYIYLWVDERPLPLSLAFIATLMFCFPVGYATLTPLRNYIENKPNIIKLILYLGIGYSFNFLWSFFASPFTVDPVVTFSLILFSTVITLYSIYHNNTFQEYKNKQNHLNKNRKLNLWRLVSYGLTKFYQMLPTNKGNIVIFSAFVFLFLFIMLKIQTFGWSPYGDANIHSYLTGIQIFNGSLLEHIPFLPNLKIEYPLGMHFFTANLSLLYNYPPPQSLLVLAGVSVFLLSAALLGIVYTLTRSSWLSTIVLLASFYIHSSGDKITYLWGHFIIGDYPNLSGFFFIFLLILIMLIIRNKIKIQHILFLFLLVVSGIIIYPTTITYSSLILVAFVASRFKIKSNTNLLNFKRKLFEKNKNSWLNFNVQYFVIIVLGLSSATLIDHFKNVVTVAFSPTLIENVGIIYSGYTIFQYFSDDIFSISVFGGVIASVYIIVYQKQWRFIGYTVLGFILLEISGNYLGPFKIIISTVRYSAILMIFSWIVFSLIVYLLSTKNLSKHKMFIRSFDEIEKKLSNKISFRKIIIILCFGVLTTIVVIGEDFIINHALNDPTQAYVRLEPHLSAMDWIFKNVKKDELILNYEDEEGFPIRHPIHWIHSIEYQYQINGILGTVKVMESEEREEINNNFSNYPHKLTLQETLRKYDVKYVIVLPRESRDRVLQSYDFLDVVFQNKHDIIYSVTTKSIPLVNLIEDRLDEAEELRNSDSDSAIMIYNDIINLDSSEIKAWQGKIRVLIKTNQYEEALFVSDVMIEKFDDLRKSQRGDTEEFSHLYQKVLNIRDITIKQIAEDINQRLDEVKKLEKTDPYSAIIKYDDILDSDKSEFRAWKGKIRVLIETNQYEEALSVFDKMVEKFDSLRNSQLRGTEKYETFFRYYQEALKSKAILGENIEDYKDALRSYNKLLDDDKFNISVLKDKARILEKMEEFRQALEVYRLINALEPNNIVTQQHLEDLIKRLSKDE